jgi:hypothetical protein
MMMLAAAVAVVAVVAAAAQTTHGPEPVPPCARPFLERFLRLVFRRVGSAEKKDKARKADEVAR